MLIQGKEKGPIDVGASADHEEIISTPSIPQQPQKLSITMEQIERDPIGLDSFPLGTVRSFRLYLKAQLIFLQAGVIAP